MFSLGDRAAENHSLSGCSGGDLSKTRQMVLVVWLGIVLIRISNRVSAARDPQKLPLTRGVCDKILSF